MSAVIWLGIVVVWGFVVIPIWLRHHDGVLEQRSADRFSTAMRVLSRRAAVRPDGRNGVSTPSAQSPAARAAAARAAIAEARARRARYLLGGLITAFVTLLLAVVAGGMWIALHLVTDLALIGYVVRLRQRAVTEQRQRAARRAHERRAEAARAALLATLSHRDTADLPIDGSLSEFVEAVDASADDLPADDATTELPLPATARVTGQHVVRPAGSAGRKALPAREPAAGYSVDLTRRAAADDTEPFSLVQPAEATPAPAVAQDEIDTDPALPAAEADAAGSPAPSQPARRGTPRPGSRPQTSRPGRVQVNPPGSAAPRPPAQQPAAVADPAAAELAPDVAAAVAGALPPDEPDELDQLLDRNVVNG